MYSPSFDFEKKYWKDNLLVAGIDEAGRGCLAGPVSAAAVILPQNFKAPKILNDSKKIKENDRESLFEELINSNIIWAHSFVDNLRIDEINILNATYEAMIKSVEKLSSPADFLLIDGNRFPNYKVPHKCIVKGDQRSFSIAAASIIAKVKRDRFMRESTQKYPDYNFQKHKGYATKKHFQEIEISGISEIHRKTFFKKFNRDKFQF